MTDVDSISIEYSNQVEDISISYENEITDIVLAVGGDVQSIYSVNGLSGTVTLTASTTIDSMEETDNIYSFTFQHNLNYAYPSIVLYDTDNNLVYADVIIVDSNNVTIKSAIDISGYKVVVQR